MEQYRLKSSTDFITYKWRFVFLHSVNDIFMILTDTLDCHYEIKVKFHSPFV